MRLTRTSGSVGGLGGQPPRSTRPRMDSMSAKPTLQSMLNTDREARVSAQRVAIDELLLRFHPSVFNPRLIRGSICLLWLSFPCFGSDSPWLSGRCWA
jgi:hypothetical protein